MDSPTSLRQQYVDWIDEQIEECKASLTREELLDLAEQAVNRLHERPDGQYTLTELMLCDAVDALLVEKLGLPDFRTWKRTCHNDTPDRPSEGTSRPLRAAS